MTTDITELAQSLNAAAEKATPGPWYVHDKPCEDGNYGIDTSDKEFLAEAVIWWGFSRQSIWREEDAKYIALANPANILALVEALEKAQQVDEELCKLLPPGVEYMDPPDGGDVEPIEQVRRMVADYRQRIAELREWNAGLAQESFERQQRISELLEGKVGNALLERENHHVEVVGKLAERIAELEESHAQVIQSRDHYKRITEEGLRRLAESRTVKLPALPRLGANTEWYQGFAAGAESMRSDCAHAINAAGIKVEAE